VYYEGDSVTAATAIRAGRGVNVQRPQRSIRRSRTTPRPRYADGIGAGPVVGVVPDFISIAERHPRQTPPGGHWESVRRRESACSATGCGADNVRESIERALGDRYALKILTLKEVLSNDAYRRQAFAFTDAIQLLIIIVTVMGSRPPTIGIMERRRSSPWRLIGAGRTPSADR
jgi:hypothetical protein